MKGKHHAHCWSLERSDITITALRYGNVCTRQFVYLYAHARQPRKELPLLEEDNQAHIDSSHFWGEFRCDCNCRMTGCHDLKHSARLFHLTGDSRHPP